eukprot:s1161_g8.t1
MLVRPELFGTAGCGPAVLAPGEVVLRRPRRGWGINDTSVLFEEMAGSCECRMSPLRLEPMVTHQRFRRDYPSEGDSAYAVFNEGDDPQEGMLMCSCGPGRELVDVVKIFCVPEETFWCWSDLHFQLILESTRRACHLMLNGPALRELRVMDERLYMVLTIQSCKRGLPLYPLKEGSKQDPTVVIAAGQHLQLQRWRRFQTNPVTGEKFRLSQYLAQFLARVTLLTVLALVITACCAGVVQALQNQLMQQQTENQALVERVTNYEAQLAQVSAAAASASNVAAAAANGSPQHGGLDVAEVLRALQGLPDALSKLNKPKGLIDPRGLGKPQILGEDAEQKFRLWAIKLEDYVSGVFGGKSREALEWASEMDTEVTLVEIDQNFGDLADLNDQWDEAEEFNKQLYTVLRATTELTAFDVVENTQTGHGLEAWRRLHRKFDPSTGSRKRIMLQALTSPERATFETLPGALERWKTLKSRYDRKRDQFGAREKLPESLSMNALEKLVPKELEQHLLLNYVRFKNFEEMESEVITYIEAKTGSKMVLSSNFSKPSASSSNGPTPMDVDSLVRAVSGSISALSKGKGEKKGENKIKFDGNCDNCGKYGHRKRDCWAKPGGGKGASGGSRPASQSPSKKKEVKFEGKCHNCGKVGHRKSECYSKGKGKGGGQPKGNGKNASSVEQPEPEQKPENASGLDLCMLEEIKSEDPTSRHSDGSQSPVSSVCSVDPPWIKCNLDSGASITVFPKSLFPEKDPSGVRLKTASGEMINGYGDGVIYGKDSNGLMRKLNVQIADVHKILVSASKLHEKGYCTWLGPGGGEIIPLSHPINEALGKAYARAVKEHGKVGLIPVAEENGIYNFYIQEEKIRDEVASPATPEGAPEESRGRHWSPPSDARPASAGRSRSRSHRPVCAVEEEVEPRLDDEIEPDGIEAGEQVEARPARPGWSPITPSEEERREHESSGHAVFRNWCEHCLQATGYSQKHTKKDHSQDMIPTISMDYFYMNEEPNARPHLVAIDRKTGMMMATALEKKGVGDATGRKLLTRFLELLGYKEVVLKSDGEHPLVRLKKDAGREATTVTKVVCEESPAGDSKANGEAESAVREVKWRIRAVRLTLEKKLGVKLEDGHPLVQWIPRYASEQANRFRVGADGRTPEERRTGKKWIKPLPLFGEKVLIKPAGKGKKTDMARMVPARFVGMHNRFGSVLGMTSEGVIVGSGFHRLADDEQWDPLDADLRGAPWDVRAYVRRIQPEEPQQALVQPPVVVVQHGDQAQAPADLPVQADGEGAGVPGDRLPAGGVGEPSASAQRPGTAKAWPVKREHLQKFGKTIGCPGCTSLTRGVGFQQVAHNNECRARIKRSMEDEIKLREVENKKLKADDKAEEASRDEMPSQQVSQDAQQGASQGAPSSSSRPAEIVQDDMVLEPPKDESEEMPSSPTKRKGGDEGVTDVDDLFQQVEAEQIAEGASPAQAAAVEWMASVLGSLEAAQTLADLAAMDVIEVFSPSRINLEVERFGLRPGCAVDLDEMKPDGSEYWDLDKDADYAQVLDLIALEQPYLVTSSPPCTTFCPLRRLSNHKRSPEVVAEEEEIGRERLRRSMKCCEQQADQGGLFLHEHPKDAGSWKEPEVVEIRNRPDVYVVQSPMCRFGMKLENNEGVMEYVRKETLFMTNSKFIADELEGVCENKLKGTEVHRHVHLIGGQRAKMAQKYPIALVEAVLRGLKNELRARGDINMVEEMLTGPSPDDYVSWEQDVEAEEMTYDDASGALLDPELVKKAKEEELQWLRKEKVYERIPMSQVEGPLLKLKWVSVNKGDSANPKVRCRLVAKEVKKAKPVECQLGGADTFSSTPPIEAIYSLLSIFMTDMEDGKSRRLGTWDISRAHFMGVAARELFLELPQEDQNLEGDVEPMAGRLLKSMYGTQDASKIFQDDYQGHLRKHGAQFSRLCPSLFNIPERGLIGAVHGDDFMVVGEPEQLRWFDKLLNERYTARWENTLGDGYGEMFFLNRLVRFIPDGADGPTLEIEADARHAEILMTEFNFDTKTKGSDIPEEKMTQSELVDAERQPVLDHKQVTMFRSMVMRMAYMSVDRPDLCHVVRSLASAMKSPKMVDWLRLKKAVRYLVKQPYLKRVFKMQSRKDMRVEAWSDSDWAGDLKTRRSTTGSVVKVGTHTVLVKGASQKVVALSSSESEFYAMCRTSTLAEFVRGILLFWGMPPALTRLRVDSSSAKAMAERRGVGTSRHIQARYLWLQEKIFAKELDVQKINGKVNDSDLVTKVQTRAIIENLEEDLSVYETLDGRPLVPYQCAVSRQAWNQIREHFIACFLVGKTAYRRANGGSTAPTLHEDVEPRFLHRAPDPSTSTVVRAQGQGSYRMVVRNTFVEVEVHSEEEQVIEVCRRGRRPKTTTVLPENVTATVLAN